MRESDFIYMTITGSIQISAVARLFSSSVVQEMARKGKSPMFARLANEALLFSKASSSDLVRDVFDNAFAILKKKANRHEYVYKSALTQNILLGTHSLNTASMLTEFRVGKCKADVAIFNGTATVYEIKSERDSLSRLERQIASYRDVFAKVYVIAGENHVDAVFNAVPSDVGVMKLSSRLTISRLRDALDQPERTNPATIFDSIRLNEAVKILESNGVDLPSVPNTQLYSALRELFVELPPETAHTGMVAVLKKTRNLLPLADIVKQLPESLQSAALSVPFRKMDQERLLEAVNTRFNDAINW